MPFGLADVVRYQGAHGSARWEGCVVEDETAFREFVLGQVKDRVSDAEVGDPFAAELRGLATTGMATEFLERLLRAVPEPEGWEIGEAAAECILEQSVHREVVWPWNSVRDRRTPRASLPGADLVGFCCEDEATFLLFGEVKTSADASTPPNVMYGGSGMVWQLQENATRLDIQHALLRWLRTRCGTEDLRALYRAAVTRYLTSEGKDIVLVGILIRDTAPNEQDVQARARHLGTVLPLPTRVEITAFYLPVPISRWPELLRGDGA